MALFFIDLRFICFFRGRANLSIQACWLGYVENIVFLQGEEKILTAKDELRQTFCPTKHRFINSLQWGGVYASAEVTSLLGSIV